MLKIRCTVARMQGTARLRSMSYAQVRTLFIVLHHGVACKLVPAVALMLVAVHPGTVNEMLTTFMFVMVSRIRSRCAHTKPKQAHLVTPTLPAGVPITE